MHSTVEPKAVERAIWARTGMMAPARSPALPSAAAYRRHCSPSPTRWSNRHAHGHRPQFRGV